MENSTAYLSCAEPSWAATVSGRQLKGILTLSALLSEKVYLSDVHIGDNANFLDSYLRTSRYGLIQHVRGLAEAGMLDLLIRRDSVRPHSDTPRIACDTLVDVYQSWRAQDPDGAWILPPDDDVRLQFLSDVDSWSSDHVTRYDYGAVKQTYMGIVRQFTEDGHLERYASDLFSSITGSETEYLGLLARDWFSLSDIYDFFQSRGVSITHPVMLVHGLMNETAYSSQLGSSLVGADLYGEPLEDTFWPRNDHSTGNNASQQVVGELLERASHVLDTPALSVLGLLSAEEIASLREVQGRGYFDLLYLMSEPGHSQPRQQVVDTFSHVLASYWEGIAEFLREHHPEGTHRPRKLALMLSASPGLLRRFSRDTFSFALNVGVPIAASAGALPVPLAEGTRNLTSGLSLRFLFLAENEELKRIRSVIPNGAWFTKSQPVIFPSA
ncbi:hypothetical protein [Streptomyces antimycoticus]